MSVTAQIMIAASPAQDADGGPGPRDLLKVPSVHCDEGAKGQFPGPGQQREVCALRVTQRVADRKRVGGDDHDDEDDGESLPERSVALSGPPRNEEEERRIDDVELLLDSK